MITVMFGLEKGSLVSEGIELIEEVGALDFSAKFVPSHTWIALDGNTGIEASTEGIAKFPLSKYIEQPGYIVQACGLPELIPKTETQILAMADKLASEGLSYDYAGLAGDALEAFLMLDQLLPELRKVADPLHEGHALFCSALVSTILKATAQYKDIEIFREYTVSKISPLILNQRFAWAAKNFVKKNKTGGAA